MKPPVRPPAPGDARGLSIEVCRQIPGFEALLASPNSRNWRHRKVVPWHTIGPLLFEWFSGARGPVPPRPAEPPLPDELTALLHHVRTTFLPVFQIPNPTPESRKELRKILQHLLAQTTYLARHELQAAELRKIKFPPSG